MKCPKCGAQFDKGTAFCQECGSDLKDVAQDRARGSQSFMSRVERSVYFTIARAFAWFVLFLSVAALITSIVVYAPSVLNLYRGSVTVTSEEVSNAIAKKKAGKTAASGDAQGDGPAGKIDPKILADLDREIYELIVLFPAQVQQQESGVEKLRNGVLRHISPWKDYSDKISILRDVRVIAKSLPEVDRMDAFVFYCQIKANKENEKLRLEDAAKLDLNKMLLMVLSLVSIITLVSMILVLLAIERNTRRAGGGSGSK